jgi:hypothetical protein
MERFPKVNFTGSFEQNDIAAKVNLAFFKQSRMIEDLKTHDWFKSFLHFYDKPDENIGNPWFASYDCLPRKLIRHNLT